MDPARQYVETLDTKPLSRTMNAISRAHSRLIKSGKAALLCVVLFTPAAYAQTPIEAYNAGCAGCHTNERQFRKIATGDDAARRAWIVTFMSGHPCERDDLRPLIIDFLVEKTRRK